MGKRGLMCTETKMEQAVETGCFGGEREGAKTDGTLGIRLTPKSVSAVFLMCRRL